MTRAPDRARGLTLVELMVTLAILAILMAAAAPSFSGFLRNAELTAVANSFVAALNAARSAALKRNLPALVTPLDDAHTDWTQGFVAFVDVNWNARYDEGIDIVVLRRPIKGGFLSFSGSGSAKASPPYVRYDGSGFARKADGGPGNLTFNIFRNDVPDTEVIAQTRRIIIATTGRVRLCTPSSATDRRCLGGADD
ncbi:hypothetical protein BH10PSE18_BH10PSE18_37640 [soil metagenome]